jgi:hypothetical protein
MNRKSEKTKKNYKSEQTDRVPTSIREEYRRVKKRRKERTRRVSKER